MLLVESTIRYRLTRSDLSRQRALRRIVRCDLNSRRLFGEELSKDERRQEPRLNLQVPVNLRPARLRGLTIYTEPDAPPFLALTSNVSLGGLGIVHDEPIGMPVFLAEFDVAEVEPLILVVEQRWSAEVEAYSYRSGGRILGIARRP